MGVITLIIVAGEALAKQAYDNTLNQLRRLQGIKKANFAETIDDEIDEDIRSAENRLRSITSVLENHRLGG